MDKQIVKGTIEKIDMYVSPEKIVVHIRIDPYQLTFIEFRGSRTKIIAPFKESQQVIISYIHDGKISKIGKTYPNLVGRSARLVSN